MRTITGARVIKWGPLASLGGGAPLDNPYCTPPPTVGPTRRRPWPYIHEQAGSVLSRVHETREKSSTLSWRHNLDTKIFKNDGYVAHNFLDIFVLFAFRSIFPFIDKEFFVRNDRGGARRQYFTRCVYTRSYTTPSLPASLPIPTTPGWYSPREKPHRLVYLV